MEKNNFCGSINFLHEEEIGKELNNAPGIRTGVMFYRNKEGMFGISNNYIVCKCIA